MHKSIISALLAGTVALSGCTTYGKDPAVADAAIGAASGAAGGTALGAIVPGASVAEGAVAGAVIPGASVPGGAAIGAAIGGLAGAVWADNNGDGQADGYVYNGQYYAGAPQGYQQSLPAPAPAPVYAVPARGERG